MKLNWLFCLFLLLGATSRSQSAYEIKVTLKPFREGYLYLAHHYGTKQYLVDSARLNANSEAVFSGKEKLFGGIYMIVFPARNGWLECVIDKNQRFSVSADTTNLIQSTRFTGSPDNDLFSQYQKKSYETGTEAADLRKKAASATGDEAARLNGRVEALGKEIQDYRSTFIREHPEHLLSALFQVLKEPAIPPASEHPGGKYDSVYAYQFYKSHYWDGVSFTDERLIRTPVFQPKLDRYFNEVLPQHPDSLIVAADGLLSAATPNPEMFKFMLATLTDKYVNPAYMGQDAVFVHLFEKYYLTGRADSWMNEKYKKFIYDRGYSLMANTLGKKGADFPVLDTLGNKTSLYALTGKYTVICFWDPTCSHCKEEVPKVDSLFQANWKKQGVKLIGVMTDGGKPAWLSFIRQHHLTGWAHVYQTQEMKDADYAASRPGFRQLYDVYQTPMLYLLDKDKRIIAKKLSYQQLNDFLEVKIRQVSSN
jgi:peroxiredoxin